MKWPERFLKAIPVGADFTGLEDRLAISRLRVVLKLAPTWDEAYRNEVVDAIKQTIKALGGDGDDLEAAEAAAWSAARSAESAARAATMSAEAAA